MTRKILDFYQSIETITTQLVRLIVAIASFSIGELAPLVAPLAPSFSIYLAMSKRLEMPQIVALIAAGTIEVVGMYSAKISVRCYRWNITKNKAEAAVPQALSIAMTGVFFVVVLALALTIELVPGLTALIFPAFTLISVSVYVNMAIDQNLRKLETDKASELELRQEKNGLAAEVRLAKKELAELANEVEKLAAKRAKIAAENAALRGEGIKQDAAKQAANSGSAAFLPGDPAALDAARAGKKAKIAARRNEVLRLFQAGKNAPEIAAIIGNVSPDTIRRDIKNLNGSLK